jgi:methionyl-tRNA formyltransferase
MRIVFMGTPEFAVPSLKRLVEEGHEVVAVVTQPDRPKGRGKKMMSSAVKEAAQKLGIPVLQPERIRDSQWVAQIDALAPDLIVTAAFGQILPRTILEIPMMGSLNVHASLLPAYRGAAPIHWALIRGESETGVTIMRMDVGMDTGDMILQEGIPITEKDNVDSLHEKLATLGASLLVQAVELIGLDPGAGTPQDHQAATYAPLLKREHERIDWHKHADDVVNHIRGMNPWPGAYTLSTPGLLKIYEAEVYTVEEDGWTIREDIPGMVVKIIPRHGFVVATGMGHVLVKKVKPENGRIMKADEFVRGYRLQSGDYLGGSL